MAAAELNIAYGASGEGVVVRQREQRSRREIASGRAIASKRRAMTSDSSTPPNNSTPIPANRLRELAQGERPQERLERHGAAALSDSELLAMVLRSGTAGNDVLTLATRLLAEAGSLAALVDWRVADFRKLKGIGRVKALQLVTVLELARRVASQRLGEAPVLAGAAQVAELLQPLAVGLRVEKFWLLCLDRKDRLLKRIEIGSGTAVAVLVHPREVFREAVREGAIGVICAHNHPSGDPTPSAPDIQVTRQLREAARLLDIKFLDHVIVGRSSCDPLGLGYYSFRQAGVC
jgi:DNA repair protein RadC